MLVLSTQCIYKQLAYLIMLDTRPSLLSSDITDSVESVGTACTSNGYFVLDSLTSCVLRG